MASVFGCILDAAHAPSGIPLPACAVDAAVISEPGSTGTDWRLHCMLEMPSLTCTHFKEGIKGGGSFSRFPVRDGHLLIAGRAYRGITGIEYVKESGCDVIGYAETVINEELHSSMELIEDIEKQSRRICAVRFTYPSLSAIDAMNISPESTAASKKRDTAITAPASSSPDISPSRYGGCS